jgi:transcription-repair coupling factor (superfamily II helicase)
MPEAFMSGSLLDPPLASPFQPPLPGGAGERLQWGQLSGAAASLAAAHAARRHPALTLAVAEDVQAALRLESELRFFLGGSGLEVLTFPDWETLPYDVFSPLPELVSRRLLTLHRLAELRRGVLVVPVGTLLQRLPPRPYLEAHTLRIEVGERLDLDRFRQRLERAGYRCVSQVVAHGEFAVRGSLLDFFPMGYDAPFRMDLLDDQIDSIRTFDPDSQRSQGTIPAIRSLPARELPLDEEGIARFRKAFRNAFEGDPQRSPIYREVSAGNALGGIEYYLPLFYEQTSTLFDYLPDGVLALQWEGVREAADAFLAQVRERYEQRRHDLERPLLPPVRLYLDGDELAAALRRLAGVHIQATELVERRKGFSGIYNFATSELPPVGIQARAPQPAAALQGFIATQGGRVLFLAESPGRREHLLDTLKGFDIRPRVVEDWDAFLQGEASLALAVAPLERGLLLTPRADRSGIALVTETLLYGERVLQERRQRKARSDPEQMVRNLTELHIGAPVVHEQHGVGRYLGLQTLQVGGIETELLTLEYAKGDRLYVPVSSLHLISRYTGSSPETAPLHRLGGDQWEKIKKKATEQVRDVAAELLDIHARRAAHQGHALPPPGDEYAAFAAAFELEETPDQLQAIEAVLADMAAPRPMDRVVCGDVGFGKTEVAMRAAFQAVQAGRQVAVLVPTTLLAEQHHANFSDRFADWPIRIESLSRFRTPKEQKAITADLANGRVDIVVGTHKLLQSEICFKDLGLVIVDEEHRFGVRHKERLKALRAEVDLLTLTATPIPRTLNMAMAGMRDLSIIATPPAERHPIKTFVSEWNDALVVEACQRELKRGGQVYFLHNEVQSIDETADKLRQLLPGARIEVAHGQMRERELERIMRDFYHQRFHILVCTTIVESGIDVPSANTIVIDRADKLGLAQLHQLRGRVGRSHHRAYAYLITPPARNLTEDARKRLEAIESLEELGAGFTLATHDLEIRGAGELLGEEQSGQIQEVGFSLYMELLERAVQALKSGRRPELERPLQETAEIDLQIPALLPADYIPDVHTRLVLYKRIASAVTPEDLRELQVELIDRFGLLPEQTKNLFAVTELKLDIQRLGIRKVEAGPAGGRIVFDAGTRIDPVRLVRLVQERHQELKLESGDKLRLLGKLEDPAVRLRRVREVLGKLSG